MPSFMGRVVSGRILAQVAVGPVGAVPTQEHVATGLLDTGATISGISPRLVERLGLENTGEWMTVAGVHGPQEVAAYRVSMVLPLSETIPAAFVRRPGSIQVAELSLEQAGIDVLLGMDFLHPLHLTLHKDFFIISG